MKKFFYIALAMMACTLGFTACEDDEGGDSSYNLVADPGATVAGSYNGTYTRTLESASESAQGTIVLEKADQPYYVNVTFNAVPELGINKTATVKANIVQKDDNTFIISNTGGTNNALGTSFRIYVTSGKMQANFILNVKVGRKAYDYSYVFTN